MKCSRCQNEDVQYFFENNGRIYCRKCIAFSTKTVNLKSVKNEKKIYYHLNYSLNLEQERTSRLLIERYQNHQNTVLKAVTGAGKTEMIYGVIEYALNLGHHVCLTMPRKELVIELAKRIQKQFFNIQPILVYGGHTECLEGQFIICTTHQLYRYPRMFDLLILDEYDAFPYRDNEVLENILMNSIKGNYVFMSATIESGDVQVLQRFHHQPLPIPTCKVMGNFMMLCHLVYQLKKYQKDKKPVFLFVPRIEMTRQVQKFLKFFSIKSHCATSKEKNIHQSLEMIKSHEIDVIVCTTVLERGMTVENVREYFISKSSTAKEAVEELENAINLLDKKIAEYLLLISHEQLNDHDSKEYFADMKSIKDLERVGDLCINLTQFFEAVYDEKDDFSSEAKDDIIAMINMDIEMLNHAMVAFDKHDLDDIIYVDDHESNLDYYNKKAKQRHIQRVTNKTEKSVIVNSTYVDILSNLERIGDHCQNIAESYMLEEENFKPDYEVDSAFNQ